MNGRLTRERERDNVIARSRHLPRAWRRNGDSSRVHPTSTATMASDLQSPPPNHKDRLLVQIASYNTALQGLNGVPQDLVDWLSPTLQVSHFLSRERRAPDIVAVGFQELLPLYLGRASMGPLHEAYRTHVHTQSLVCPSLSLRAVTNISLLRSRRMHPTRRSTPWWER